jgi:hypothetical protein
MTAWLNTAAMPPGVMVEVSEPAEPLLPLPAPLPALDPVVGYTTSHDTDPW